MGSTKSLVDSELSIIDSQQIWELRIVRRVHEWLGLLHSNCYIGAASKTGKTLGNYRLLKLRGHSDKFSLERLRGS